MWVEGRLNLQRWKVPKYLDRWCKWSHSRCPRRTRFPRSESKTVRKAGVCLALGRQPTKQLLTRRTQLRTCETTYCLTNRATILPACRTLCKPIARYGDVTLIV